MAKSYPAKSQSSLEYLLVVALTFIIIIPATYIFFTYSRESGNEIVDVQIIKLGTSVIDSAEFIFSSGHGSKTVLDLNVPEGIGNVYIIDGRELIFNMTTSIAPSEVVFFSPVNITTDPSNCDRSFCRLDLFADTGLKKVKIEAITPNAVSIDVI